MILEKVVTQFASKWQGPAFTFVLDQKEYAFGQGEARTKLIVKNKGALKNLLKTPSVVIGEAYMNGDIEVSGSVLDILQGYWQTKNLLEKMPGSKLKKLVKRAGRYKSRAKAIRDIKHHYDVGNDFYKLWLDPSLTYTCAYFPNGDEDIATAQLKKIDLVLQKVRIKPGQTLLDIGCGWGALIIRAAEKYGVHATGVTASKEQAKHIREQIRARNLEGKVSVIEDDYRNVEGTFDRIVSVGMFEAVGQAHFAEYFEKWTGLLAEDGISLLHTIGSSVGGTDPWFQKYIFPGSWLPNQVDLAKHPYDNNLQIIDVENLWQHYAKTLELWHENFQGVRSQVVEMYDEKFARMWEFYLLASEAGFLWGSLQLWQVVMVKGQKKALWPLDRRTNLT